MRTRVGVVFYQRGNRHVGKSGFRNGRTAYREIDSSGDSLKIRALQRLSRGMKDRSLQPPLALDLILDVRTRSSLPYQLFHRSVNLTSGSATQIR